ncbi:MAG TPA: DUF2846 domain-containing protein [Tepidisphaeraceae bacterium]|jgi:hypothetical protein|nr:DUF2846 domain-containing protein [Tepidisphaeraceae bacterium]
MIRIIGMCCVLAFISCLGGGCDGGGERYSDVGSSLAPPSAGQGRVYFYRDSRADGLMVQPEIQLNHKHIGTSIPGDYFYMDLPPGAYVCVIPKMGDVDSHGCSHTLAFTLNANETRYIRTYPHYGASLEDKATAMATLGNCFYSQNLPW